MEIISYKPYDTELKNTTTPWHSTDSEQTYDRNHTQAEQLGWSKDSITYEFNDQGWRTHTSSDSRGSGVMFLGDSFTVGIGVRQEDTWAYRVWKHSQTQCFWNLAVAGCGLDTQSRLFWSWATKLRPVKVYVMPTVEPRREFVQDQGFHCVSVQSTDSLDKQSMQRYFHWEAEQQVHRLRCRAWIQQVAQDSGIMVEWVETDLANDGLGRDLMHPGVRWHGEIAERVIRKS